MPNPPWLPPTQDPQRGECLRLAYSAVTGIHPRRLRFIDPESPRVDFWREWEQLSYERGFRWLRCTREFAEEDPERLWIAVVPSMVNPHGTHAIAMKGAKLYYDPGAIKRSRRPTKLAANPILPTPL